MDSGKKEQLYKSNSQKKRMLNVRMMPGCCALWLNCFGVLFCLPLKPFFFIVEEEKIQSTQITIL